MSNGEIIVNQTSLEEEIEALKNLLSGSGYSRNGTLLSRGYGKTFDALNQMYVDLKNVEEVLMELIQLTATALEKGGLEFNQADIQSSENISSIDGELVRG